MAEHFLIGLTGIIVLSVGAQWLAWKLKLPSILLLLIFGFFAGAVTGFIEPAELFGPSLLPAISLAVAVILFEGGLNLHWREFKEVKHTVRNLITVGAFTTWVLTAAAAHFILGLEAGLSILMGAILIVSGPTVIMPILRHLRPKGPTGPILKWEGILIDPIGAILAVIVFELIFIGKFQGFTPFVVVELLQTIMIGGIVGVVGAGLMVLLLKRYWMPDFLHSPVTLMMVVGVFTFSDTLQPESGLFAAIAMGIALANQRFVSMQHIMEFKENLQVLLIGGLFIVLAAQLQMSDLSFFNAATIAFLAALIFIIRPIAVYLSSRTSELDAKAKTFLAFMAPRGIVAAAIASIFALRLEAIEYQGAEALVPVTFLTIIGTVTVYGLGALPLARRLEIADADPQGILIVGAHDWALRIGTVLKEEGIHVAFLDGNWENVSAARLEGFSATYMNVLSEDMTDEVNLGGIGYLIALTRNNQVNTLAALRFASVLGRARVFQIAAPAKPWVRDQQISTHLRGRALFGQNTTYSDLHRLFTAGAAIKTIRITEEYTYETFLRQYGNEVIPLFLKDQTGKLTVLSPETKVTPRPGQTFIAIVPQQEAQQ